MGRFDPGSYSTNSLGKTAEEISETAHNLYAYGVVLDTETTSKEEGAREIVAVAVIRPWDKAVLYESLVRPMLGLGDSTKIHGLTDAKLARAPRWRTVWPELREVVSGYPYVTAHNASFDRGAIIDTCEIHRVRTPAVPCWNWHDTMIGCARYFKSAWPTLEVACRYFGISFDPRLAHEASYDAIKTAEVLGKLALGEIGGWTNERSDGGSDSGKAAGRSREASLGFTGGWEPADDGEAGARGGGGVSGRTLDAAQHRGDEDSGDPSPAQEDRLV